MNKGDKLVEATIRALQTKKEETIDTGLDYNQETIDQIKKEMGLPGVKMYKAYYDWYKQNGNYTIEDYTDLFCYGDISGIKDVLSEVMAGNDSKLRLYAKKNLLTLEKNYKDKKNESKRTATNINWDIDVEDGETLDQAKDKCDLPNSIEIPDDVEDEDVGDYISDKTGFCHKGYDLEDKSNKENLDISKNNSRDKLTETVGSNKYDTLIRCTLTYGQDTYKDSILLVKGKVNNDETDIDVTGDFCFNIDYEVSDIEEIGKVNSLDELKSKIENTEINDVIKAHILGNGKYPAFIKVGAMGDYLLTTAELEPIGVINAYDESELIDLVKEYKSDICVTDNCKDDIKDFLKICNVDEQIIDTVVEKVNTLTEAKENTEYVIGLSRKEIKDIINNENEIKLYVKDFIAYGDERSIEGKLKSMISTTDDVENAKTFDKVTADNIAYTIKETSKKFKTVVVLSKGSLEVKLGKNKEVITEAEDDTQIKTNLTEDDIIDKMWNAVCTGDINYVRNAYNKDLIKPNTRYKAFGDTHSFIMGALRNRRFEMIDVLKEFGEKLKKDEVAEYSMAMAKQTYEDDLTKSALDESVDTDTEKIKPMMPNTVKIFMSKDGESKAEIVRVLDNKYRNYYYDTDLEHFTSKAGNFDNIDEAVKMLKKHRPNIEEVWKVGGEVNE